MKHGVLACLAVFVTWSILDFIGHGLILGSLYAALPGVWRPQAEIKMGVLYAGVLTTAAVFVAIYSRLVRDKGVQTGAQFGLLFGLASGASTACSGYAVHPIQLELAIGWFVLILIEATLGGLILGLIVGPCSDEASREARSST